MKRTFLTIGLLLCCLMANAQLNFTWELVPMDSAWDEIKDPAATNVILKYADLLEPLQEIIGYSTDEFDKYKPESGLSNFAADAIRDISASKCNCKVDIAMTNFGGIRASLPAGAVRVYDVLSIFPFDNFLVVFDITGRNLQEFLNNELKANRLQALSNVQLVINNGKFEKCLVDGAPIDPDRVYKFATINFLMEGGDSVQIGKYAQNVTNTDVFIRDAIVEYIKGMTERGEKIDLKEDGRVILK